MTQDVRQWLAEIKNLQQKLAEVRQERDEAYKGAANWRKLYEQEAQQRRAEAHLHQQTADALKLELDQLRHPPQQTDASLQLAQFQQQIDHLDIAELKQQLAEALLAMNRLKIALKLEQTDHAKTRSSLTTALGDTIDQLTRERNGNGTPLTAKTNGSVASDAASPVREGLKTPSPERLSGDPAQSRT